MSFTLEDSKLTDQKSKDLVFGFIKEAQGLLPSSTYYNIPALVAHVCLVYYYLNEYFDPENIESFEFQDEEAKDCIVKTNNLWCCAYLHTVVSSGKHHWKFEFQGIDSDAEFGIPEIGLAIIDKIGEESEFGNMRTYFTEKGGGYAYIVSKQCLTDPRGEMDESNSYGPSCKDREKFVIDMYADFDKLEIRYSVDEEDYGVAFKEIKPKKYRAAITASERGNKIRLLQYGCF